jgi:hypothetical protein
MAITNINTQHIYTTGLGNICARLEHCDPRFLIDLCDPNSNLPTVIHLVKYKGSCFRIKCNSTYGTVNKFWLAAMIFCDGCWSGDRFSMGLTMSSLDTLIMQI